MRWPKDYLFLARKRRVYENGKKCRKIELACGSWLTNLALLWQLSNDAFARIKRWLTEASYLPNSSTSHLAENSRI
jgi:hypothetical protein